MNDILEYLTAASWKPGRPAPGNNLIVYGKPEDVKGASPPQTWRNGQPRYFGYTWDGNYYTNKDFPNDATSGTPRAKKQWIETPWDKKLLYRIRRK